jgi:hypothetical protein
VCIFCYFTYIFPINYLVKIPDCKPNLRFHNNGEDVTCFPDGLLRNLTCLKISNFPKLKRLPNEPFNIALECLSISSCGELESIPEQTWEGLRSLRTIDIGYCGGLRSFPESIRHLTSLEFLKIRGCPTFKERCKKGTGEDWDKIAHIPKLHVDRMQKHSHLKSIDSICLFFICFHHRRYSLLIW